jgi:hypothetical protein
MRALLGLAITSARIGAEIVVSAIPTEADQVRFAIVDLGSTAQPAVAPDDLALHLSRRVIESHGGRLGVEGAAAGRTVWFTLPTGPRLLRS